MKKLPPIITWRLTSRCHHHCPYCYGPNPKMAEMPISQVEKMVKLFETNQVKVVDLTGGEPLLHPNFEKIIKLLKQKNFDLFIDTSGDHFFKYADLIRKNFKGIGLTIDFPNLEKSYKEKNNLDTVISIIKYLTSFKKHPIIRVGTVVTKDNYQSLVAIGRLLTDYKIDLWKIYQFIPQNRALENRTKLEIPTQKFVKATANLKRLCSTHFKVIVSKLKDRDSCYFFVGSDGTVFMPTKKGKIFEELIVGNIFDKHIADKWAKFVSKKNFVSNTERTLKFKFRK